MCDFENGPSKIYYRARRICALFLHGSFEFKTNAVRVRVHDTVFYCEEFFCKNPRSIEFISPLFRFLVYYNQYAHAPPV